MHICYHHVENYKLQAGSVILLTESVYSSMFSIFFLFFFSTILSIWRDTKLDRPCMPAIRALHQRECSPEFALPVAMLAMMDTSCLNFTQKGNYFGRIFMVVTLLLNLCNLWWSKVQFCYFYSFSWYSIHSDEAFYSLLSKKGILQSDQNKHWTIVYKMPDSC